MHKSGISPRTITEDDAQYKLAKKVGIPLNAKKDKVIVFLRRSATTILPKKKSVLPKKPPKAPANGPIPLLNEKLVQKEPSTKLVFIKEAALNATHTIDIRIHNGIDLLLFIASPGSVFAFKI